MAADSYVITVFENETRKGKKEWIPYKKPWISEVSGSECKPPDEYQVPGSEWRWDCNWKVEFRQGGACDADGWEYASKMGRMYEGSSRTSRGEPKWSDKARRRLWRRVARRDVKKPIEIKKAIPKIQQNLSGVHNARMQIEVILRKSPQNAASTQLQNLITKVQGNISELLHALDSLERETTIAVDGQQYVAVIKKLRNDCLREESMLQSQASEGGGKDNNGSGSSNDRGRSSMGCGPGIARRGNGRRGSSRESASRSSFNASSPREQLANSNTPGGGGAISSSSRGGSFVTGSSGEGNKRGVLNMSSSKSPATGAGGWGEPSTPEFGSIHGDLENKWDDDFAEQTVFKTPGGGTGARGAGSGLGLGVDQPPEDGVFLDRSQHTQMVEQKLVPVDEGTIMQDIINERNEEIEAMHKGLVEVNAMFVDLGLLVKEQGENIQQIFENTAKAKDTSAEAMENVKKAEKLQSEGCTMV
jgi:hypothetical protein